jgi:hypothetical protein
MSLDGFVADPDDGVEHVFKWYSAGGSAAELIEEAGRGVGVLVTARRTFDIAHAWGGPGR